VGYISNGQISVCGYTVSFKWSSDAQFHLDSHIPPNGFSILHVNKFEFTLLCTRSYMARRESVGTRISHQVASNYKPTFHNINNKKVQTFEGKIILYLNLFISVNKIID